MSVKIYLEQDILTIDVNYEQSIFYLNCLCRKINFSKINVSRQTILNEPVYKRKNQLIHKPSLYLFSLSVQLQARQTNRPTVLKSFQQEYRTINVTALLKKCFVLRRTKPKVLDDLDKAVLNMRNEGNFILYYNTKVLN